MDLAVAYWRKSSFSGVETNCVEVAFWRKSSFSGPETACVEVAGWRKSTHSGPETECVEVSFGDAFGVRDSKNPAGGALVLPEPGWRAFLATARR
jgi:hypothetical protein